MFYMGKKIKNFICHLKLNNLQVAKLIFYSLAFLKINSDFANLIVLRMTRASKAGSLRINRFILSISVLQFI